MKLVRYIPNSAIGTPASMPWEQADRQLVTDCHRLRLWLACGLITEIVWPVIEGTP